MFMFNLLQQRCDADVRGGWEDVQVGYLLGRGSSGSVYRATCNGQHVAVKVRLPVASKPDALTAVNSEHSFVTSTRKGIFCQKSS